MAERIDWLDDDTASGAPFNPRFGDRYRSESGGLDQARHVFLAGCGLPGAWASKPQWCILETGFGLGLNFLVAWQAWKADPLRPRLLHFVSVEAFPASKEDILRGASAHPDLRLLATQLHDQLWGLLPGFHRLVFEEGRVLLTLCIGDAQAMLRQQSFDADAVYLDGFSPQKNPDIWNIHTLKAVARCCRRGTRVATWTVAREVRDALSQAGFKVAKVPGIAPKRDNLQGEYNPAWKPKKPVRPDRSATTPPGTCVVIGAGLAGAAVATSLARRGWQVLVLDAAGAPACGASGLPAGLLVPHVSPDDSWLSRLSRIGVRMTLQQAGSLLQRGSDWELTGVLEHNLDHLAKARLPRAWSDQDAEASRAWSRVATLEQLEKGGLLGTDAALWHAPAGWIKPSSLVHAWLRTPGVTWQGHAQAHRLTLAGDEWQVLDDGGSVLAQAPLVVLAAGYASQALTARTQSMQAGAGSSAVVPALQAVRGQVSWGLHTTPMPGAPVWPAFPVNGGGSLIPAAPSAGGLAWIMGSTYTRDGQSTAVEAQDHHDNFGRLQTLLPALAARLGDDFNSGRVQGWAGIRCATPGRLPVVGCISQTGNGAQVWLCSGMGSRGLTFAHLCAELLAAHLHGEPLPLEQRLSQAMALTPN